MNNSEPSAGADAVDARKMTPLELWEDVPGLQEGTYLNFGAHGPSPQYVVDAADEFLRSHEYESPIDSDPYEAAFDEFDRTRERLATFVGAGARRDRAHREHHCRDQRHRERARLGARRRRRPD